MFFISREGLALMLKTRHTRKLRKRESGGEGDQLDGACIQFASLIFLDGCGRTNCGQWKRPELLFSLSHFLHTTHSPSLGVPWWGVWRNAYSPMNLYLSLSFKALFCAPHLSEARWTVNWDLAFSVVTPRTWFSNIFCLSKCFAEWVYFIWGEDSRECLCALVETSLSF